MAPRSQVIQRSSSQKAHLFDSKQSAKVHLLDMTLIPAKYEIDGLHNHGTTGQKRKSEIQM